MPQPGNPQSLNRYSYVLNNPLNYIDPSGHREVRYNEGEWITQGIFSEYAAEWDTAEQARNCAIIETVLGVGDAVLAMLWEPYDWISTGARCTQGECSWLDYAGFLPLIPGALGRVDDVARAADKIDDTTDILRHGDGIGEVIYKGATGTPNSLTPRPGLDDLDLETGGLSFFNSLEKMSEYTNFDPGSKYVTVDSQQLSGLDVIFDNVPPGHVTVRPPTLAALQEWSATKGTGVVHLILEK